MQIEPDAPQPAARARAAMEWPARRAEFRFASDAALERALASVVAQPWIGVCAVDRSRRLLTVTLAAGTPAAEPAADFAALALRVEGPPELH